MLFGTNDVSEQCVDQTDSKNVIKQLKCIKVRDIVPF